MTASRQLALLGFFLAAAMIFAKVAEIALRPEHYAALVAFGHALIRNVVVQAVLITVALVGLVSLCAMAWDKADRRYRNSKTERGDRAA